MTVVLDIAESRRKTFMEFLKTLPSVTVVSEEPVDEDSQWNTKTAQQFLAGYADSDAIYAEL